MAITLAASAIKQTREVRESIKVRFIQHVFGDHASHAVQHCSRMKQKRFKISERSRSIACLRHAWERRERSKLTIWMRTKKVRFEVAQACQLKKHSVKLAYAPGEVPCASRLGCMERRQRALNRVNPLLPLPRENVSALGGVLHD
jgi:cAMP phosphodiesterase